MRALLELGAAIDKAESTTRGGPLYYACSKGHLEVARMLIGCGANVNQVAESNDTASVKHTSIDHIAPVFQNGVLVLAPTSGFEMCFAIGSRHRQNTSQIEHNEV